MKRTIPGERSCAPPARPVAESLEWMQPYVRQSGDEVRTRWAITERKLLDYLLVHVVSGKGLFSVAGRSFQVRANSLVWIPPDTAHEMQCDSDTMHVRFIHFDLIYNRKRSHWDACIPGGTLDLSPWKSLLHPPLPQGALKKWCGVCAFRKQG